MYDYLTDRVKRLEDIVIFNGGIAAYTIAKNELVDERIISCSIFNYQEDYTNFSGNAKVYYNYYKLYNRMC